MKDYLLVGGSHVEGMGARPSGFFRKLCQGIVDNCNPDMYTYVNGIESKEHLISLLNITVDHKIIFWFAAVPNSWKLNEEATLGRIKQLNYRCMLVCSKFNGTTTEPKYSDAELIGRALAVKANVAIEFKKNEEQKVFSRLFDCLGNCFAATYDIEELFNAIKNRLTLLSSVIRWRSTSIDEEPANPPQLQMDAFLNVVHEYAEVYSVCMAEAAKNGDRFFGNCSFRAPDHFRCLKLFPSMRSDSGIYVSPRNVDKKKVSSMVLCKLNEEGNGVEFIGERKPSVDTPVQLLLYSYYKNINYMVHGHTYVETAIITDTVYPCGAVQEAECIIRAAPDPFATRLAINIKGHGHILMGQCIEDLIGYECDARPVFERC
ncbi:hypothetical protein PCE1_004459 [Barthelona sp. PCE]